MPSMKFLVSNGKIFFFFMAEKHSSICVYMYVCLFIYSHLHLLFLVFLRMVILTSVKYLFVALICTPLIAFGIESFSCVSWPPLSVSTFFGKKWLFIWSAYFLIWFVVLLLSCLNSSYILTINPLSGTQFANNISYLVGYLFILFVISFAVK